MNAHRSALLADFLSRDTARILPAAWAVLFSREPAELDPLVPAVDRIRSSVRRVDLGGLIRPNAGNVEAALRKLEDYAEGACWCQAYTRLDQFDPEKEQDAGHVRILSTSEPGWSMTFDVECTVCGREFGVEQGEYHVMWWKWVPRGEKRRRQS